MSVLFLSYVLTKGKRSSRGLVTVESWALGFEVRISIFLVFGFSVIFFYCTS